MEKGRDCHCCRTRCRQLVTHNKLLVATGVGVLVGVVLGGVLRLCHLSEDGLLWLSIWGDLFIRMLKLVILPLIMSCLITGISSLEGRAGGYLGAVTLTYIFSTHFVSVIVASIFSVLIRPGSRWAALEQELENDLNLTRAEQNTTYSEMSQKQTSFVNYNDIVADFLRNLFPDNIIKACLQNAYTERTYIHTVNEHGENVTSILTAVLYRDGTNMLGIILFSISLGFAIAAAGEDGKPLVSVFSSLSKAIFLILNVIFWYSPFAITSLIASAIVKIQDLHTVLASIGLYITTFLVCSLLHQFLLMPLMYLMFTRKNPCVYYFHILEGIITGFGPPSSASALPLLLSSCKNKLGIDSKVADFVLPVAVTINRDGSVIFVVVTTFFVAQSRGINIGFGYIVLVCILSSLLAAAIAAVPSSSLILLITITSAVNIPIGDRMAVIMALEWLQDRIRTTNNIASSAYGCAVIDKVCKKFLKPKAFVDVDTKFDASSHDNSIEDSLM